MALGHETRSMKKQATEAKLSGTGIIAVVFLLLLIAGLICMFLPGEKKQNGETAAPAKEIETSETVTEEKTDEDGKPTPEYLNRLEESQAMEDYYQQQMEEAEKQLMQQQDPDDLAGQPY